MRLVFRLAIACALAAGAWAGPVTYFLNGVTLNNGGTATGSFTFNADAGTACSTPASPCGLYSSVNIVTTLGSSLSGSTYNFVCGTDVASCTGVKPDSTEVMFLTSNAVNQSGQLAIAFFFTGVGGVPPAGLSDAGGIFDISNSSIHVGAVQEAPCSDAACSTPGSPSRVTTAGTVSSTPEPGSMVLLGSALAALGCVAMRRRATCAR